MRFYIELECSDNEVPIEYRRNVISICKSVLKNSAEGRYYDRFYKDRDNIGKDFCFSVVFPKGTQFNSDKIILSDKNFKVYFSTDDKNKTGLILINSFLNNKLKKFPLANHNYLILKSVQIVKQDIIISSSAEFRTFAGSSIVVREHKKETNTDNYYSIDDEKFQKQFMHNLKVQAIGAGFSQSQVDTISVSNVFGKRVLVKNYDIYVTSNIMTFKMSADPELLQYFYDVGIGSKHSMGFGMLTLLAQ